MVSQDADAHHVSVYAGPQAIGGRLVIDDSPTFRHPIIAQTLKQADPTFDSWELGLSPGTLYYVQLQPSGAQASFVLSVPKWTEPYLTYAYAKQAWQTAGRMWVSQYSGATWSESQQNWLLNTRWPDASNMAAQDAYFLEYPLRSAINMGLVQQDIGLLDEIAKFFVAYEPRFTTLGALRKLKTSGLNTAELTGEGPDSIRTLPWIMSNQGSPDLVETCYLCTAQFLHPAARLLRIISTLPAKKRTPSMTAFAAWYGPLLVEDHLMNILYNAPYENRTARWNALCARIPQSGMSDLDLWLLAATAEIVGANGNDPAIVHLTLDEQSKLQQAIETGTKLLQLERTVDQSTRNFEGSRVGSTSYFNGDDVKLSDYAFSAYTGESFPVAADASVNVDASWDTSHVYRLPVALRSLLDNRKVSHLTFPGWMDVQLLANQFAYRVFQGDFGKPLFHTYFDGGNGWYRVGYHGSNFGYPPAEYCNSPVYRHIYVTYCVQAGAIQGWGMISFWSPDLLTIQHALLALAASQDPEAIAFREQYYQYEKPYSFVDDEGRPQYPTFLLWILSGVAERLQ